MRWFVAFAVLAILVLVSLAIGAADLWGGDLDTWLLLSVSRWPRTAAALLTGAGLALAGVVVQLALGNRLVEPGMTGTPEAAALGLLAITLVAPGAAIPVKMCVAAVAALAGTAVFFLIARHVPRDDPSMLPLVGIIYSGIVGAVALWLAWRWELLQLLGTWQGGDFSGVLRGRYELLWLIAVASAGLYLLADRITILGLGEDSARSLGLDYRQTLFLGLGFVAIVSALVVSTVGTLPFVGLIVPNLVSRWRGDNLRANLPLVALGGAGAVLAADILGRVVRMPYEIPAASIFAVVGAGMFLWLLNAAPGSRQQG